MGRQNVFVNRILRNVPSDVFIPRRFHLELLSSVLEGNVIVCSEDSNLNQYLAHQLLVKHSRALLHGNKKAIFLMNEGRVGDMVEFFRRRGSLQAKHITTEEMCDSGDFPAGITDYWATLLEKYHVWILSTAALIRMEPTFRAGFWAEHCCVLVVDEGERILDEVDASENDEVSCWPDCGRALRLIAEEVRQHRTVHLLVFVPPITHWESAMIERTAEQLENCFATLESLYGARVELVASAMVHHLVTLRAFKGQLRNQQQNGVTGVSHGEEIIMAECESFPGDLEGLVQGLLEDLVAHLEDVDLRLVHEDDHGRRIDVLDYCLRATRECQRMLQAMGLWCCHLIAKVFVKHLLTLEVTRRVQEDEPARLLRFTASQLSMICRLLNTAYLNVYDAEGFLQLLSPKLRQLVSILVPYKPNLDKVLDEVCSAMLEADRLAALGAPENGICDGLSDTSSSVGTGATFHTDDEEDAGDRGGPTVCVRRNSFRSSHGDSAGGSARGNGSSASSRRRRRTKGGARGHRGLKSPAPSGDASSTDGGEAPPESLSSTGRKEGSRRGKNCKDNKAKTAILSASNEDKKECSEDVSEDSECSSLASNSRVVPRTGSMRFTCLIYTESQFTAYALGHVLDELCIWHTGVYFLKPSQLFAVSGNTADRQEQHGTLPSPSSVQLSTRQEEIVRQFRSGELNLLVLTRDLEKCNLKVPRCQLVISFESSGSYTAHLMARNRLRPQHQSRFIHLVARGEEESRLRGILDKFERLNSLISERLNPHSSLRLASTPYNLAETRRYPPWRPASCGSESTFEVGLSQAIHYVNRYCARLPSDCYSQLTPLWSLQEKESSSGTQFQCSLRLPINSPLKRTVNGIWMSNPRLAMMSAALATLQALDKLGELRPGFFPLAPSSHKRATANRSSNLGSSSVRVFEVDENGVPIDNFIIGSSKRRQHYFKKSADLLFNCVPKAEVPVYIHYVRHCLTQVTPQAQNPHCRPITDPDDEPIGFAFLSTKPLRHVPAFPIFTRSGEETVHIDLVQEEKDGSLEPVRLLLSCEEMESLYAFHHILFRSVLRIGSETVLQLDLERAYTQLVVVPVLEQGARIHWDLVRDVRQCYVPQENICRMAVTRDDDGKFVFNEEDFVNAVVMPSYRGLDVPQCYYVSAVRHDVSTKHPFPHEMYADFEDYYTKKYNVKLTRSNQPLLDVEMCSMRLTMLLPRYVTSRGFALPVMSSENRQLRETDRHRQFFVPELSWRHPLPASVWRKSVCLPSVLYRVNMLLLASELRDRIAMETGVGLASSGMLTGQRFPDLVFAYSLDCGTAGPDSTKSTASQPSQHAAVRVGSKKGTRREVLFDGTASAFRRGQESSGADGDSGLEVFKKGLLESKLLEEGEEDEEEKEKRKLDEEDDELEKQKPVENGESETPKDQDWDVGIFRAPEDKEYLEEESDVESEDSFEGNVRFDDHLDEESSLEMSLEPSPAALLPSLTLSAAVDLFNLERLETVGDSFLKFAITVNLFLLHPREHEGSLSYLRSRQVSNFNLYRLAKEKGLSNYLFGTKFDPLDTWVPPGYIVPYDCRLVGLVGPHSNTGESTLGGLSLSQLQPFYSRIQQAMTDKNLSDCVESIVGCYLVHAGEEAALRVMHWLGLQVSLHGAISTPAEEQQRSGRRRWPLAPSPLHWFLEQSQEDSPHVSPEEYAQHRLDQLLEGCEGLEDILKYHFQDRSFLLQALSHSSYFLNDITDCYQRLEFLGDAVLDYVITRYLYQDSQGHSPGVLTDLRSAMVNNLIFAGLAVKWNLHHFLRHCTPDLFAVVDRYVRLQKRVKKDDLDFITQDYQVKSEKGATGRTKEGGDIGDGGIMFEDGEEAGGADTGGTAGGQDGGGAAEEDEEGEGELGGQGGILGHEDVEIPKILGDLFESIAGAVYLDSGYSLDTVWRVFYPLLRERIERYSDCIPKSPVRELQESQPEIVKFRRPRRIANGKIRVCVHVIGKGKFYGLGRNYRIAKSAAAKRALRVLHQMSNCATAEKK